MTEGLSLQTIAEALDRLRGIIHRTPIITTHSEPWPLGAELRLKAENFQVTGSFKIRGAFNKIAVLERAQYKAWSPHPLAITVKQSPGLRAILAWRPLL